MLIGLFGRGDFEQRKQIGNRLRHCAIRLRGAPVCYGTFHLFGKGLFVVDEVDGISFALAHLAGSIEPGDFYCLISKVPRGLLGKVFGLVYRIKTACKPTRHFHVLLLVFAYGHLDGLVDKDVGRHQRGVGE